MDVSINDKGDAEVAEHKLCRHSSEAERIVCSGEKRATASSHTIFSAQQVSSV